MSSTEIAIPTRGNAVALRNAFSRNLLGLGLLGLIAWFSLTVPSFFAATTAVDVLNQTAILAVVVFPFTLLLITGYVDLSVGSNMALAATAGAIVMSSTQSIGIGLLACCGVGCAVGAINGLLAVQFGFSPIIVTLATLTACRGLAEWLFNVRGQTFGSMPAGITEIGTRELLGVPVIVVIAGAVFVVCGFALRYAPVGRHLYAIGVNPRAAYLSGIRVKTLPTLLYLGVGAVTGLAAWLYISRYVSVQPATLGQGFEIQVLTAVLLGGVAFTGGHGTVVGAGLGVLVLGVLSAGLQQMAVLPATQLLIQGLVLGAAAGLQWWRSRLAT